MESAQFMGEARADRGATLTQLPTNKSLVRACLGAEIQFATFSRAVFPVEP
jgi:hypothetical protein